MNLIVFFSILSFWEQLVAATTLSAPYFNRSRSLSSCTRSSAVISTGSLSASVSASISLYSRWRYHPPHSASYTPRSDTRFRLNQNSAKSIKSHQYAVSSVSKTGQYIIFTSSLSRQSSSVSISEEKWKATPSSSSTYPSSSVRCSLYPTKSFAGQSTTSFVGISRGSTSQLISRRTSTGSFSFLSKPSVSVTSYSRNPGPSAPIPVPTDDLLSPSRSESHVLKHSSKDIVSQVESILIGTSTLKPNVDSFKNSNITTVLVIRSKIVTKTASMEGSVASHITFTSSSYQANSLPVLSTAMSVLTSLCPTPTTFAVSSKVYTVASQATVTVSDFVLTRGLPSLPWPLVVDTTSMQWHSATSISAPTPEISRPIIASKISGSSLNTGTESSSAVSVGLNTSLSELTMASSASPISGLIFLAGKDSQHISPIVVDSFTTYTNCPCTHTPTRTGKSPTSSTAMLSIVGESRVRTTETIENLFGKANTTSENVDSEHSGSITASSYYESGRSLNTDFTLLSSSATLLFSKVTISRPTTVMIASRTYVVSSPTTILIRTCQNTTQPQSTIQLASLKSSDVFSLSDSPVPLSSIVAATMVAATIAEEKTHIPEPQSTTSGGNTIALSSSTTSLPSSSSKIKEIEPPTSASTCNISSQQPQLVDTLGEKETDTPTGNLSQSGSSTLVLVTRTITMTRHSRVIPVASRTTMASTASSPLDLPNGGTSKAIARIGVIIPLVVAILA